MEIRGDRASLRTDDSDATVVALAEQGAIRGLAVAPATLEDAFLALTAQDAPDDTPPGPGSAGISPRTGQKAAV